MIYWVFILALIVEIYLYIKVYHLDYCSALELVILITTLIILILTIFIIGANIDGKHEKIALEAEYETLLEYKSRIDYIQNECYISEVIDWNITVSSGKSIQRDFWVGVFIPNIYDDFDVITLN